MDLRQARHPLIDPEIIVPNNIMLGKDFTTIVITGPNTGGKNSYAENSWYLCVNGAIWPSHSSNG